MSVTITPKNGTPFRCHMLSEHDFDLARAAGFSNTQLWSYFNQERFRNLFKMIRSEQEKQIHDLERLCDDTYVAQGADAYNHACDEMERWQEQRKKAGKEIGTEGSLCDGISWLYEYIDTLEAAQGIKGAA